MNDKKTGTDPDDADSGEMSAKSSILRELETLTNQGKFEELVNLYITSFLETDVDPERLRKIKKKVIKKLSDRQHLFLKAPIDQIKMKVLNKNLEMQLKMLQNELTRTIVLLVSYMVKHGNDETAKEVFRWIKEHKDDEKEHFNRTLEKGQGPKKPKQ